MFKEILEDKKELILLRKKLLTYCSKKILSRITIDNLEELIPYIAPYPFDKLASQIKKSPRILYYLTLEDVDYLSIEPHKEDLISELMSIAKGEFIPEEAGVKKTQLAAIQLLLSKIETKAKPNSDLSVKELQSLLPQSVKKLSTEELEKKIKMLEEN